MTERQIEVLRLIGQGQTDKQIARTLGLSHRTIEMHVSRLLEVLNCHTRSEDVYLDRDSPKGEASLPLHDNDLA
ncbi:MAG: response regulator transcription factor [Variovorax sp.]|nr:MAG: response regulator transcription factor [Variovorax sp.]